ncbi:MAG: rRNA maturation RNase YbeY [Gammaproteobacteria bacterium]|nr:rRNA maturation RNase YbeY [Gammaproteobacteria bacterium]NNJ90805.1 rRNA maturation RNase YbeY [Gammaproteobacteria bacterium]
MTTSPDIEIQRACNASEIPDDNDLQLWAGHVLEQQKRSGSVVIRLVDADESQSLNHQYRHKDYATNILSFPFEAPQFIEQDHLGDLVICVPVVNREAGEQGKQASAHWAHMVIHGMLHLMGYDHETPAQADEMESIEIELLQQLDIRNPYK